VKIWVSAIENQNMSIDYCVSYQCEYVVRRKWGLTFVYECDKAGVRRIACIKVQKCDHPASPRAGWAATCSFDFTGIAAAQNLSSTMTHPSIPGGAAIFDYYPRTRKHQLLFWLRPEHQNTAQGKSESRSRTVTPSPRRLTSTSWTGDPLLVTQTPGVRPIPTR